MPTRESTHNKTYRNTTTYKPHFCLFISPQKVLLLAL
nr:MAG TPA_asm: hypothetical protein [Caudoviricetes sp.]